jgi:hypothetical protein
MTRGELERAHRHYDQWMALQHRRRVIAERGFMLVPGTLDEETPPLNLPSDHPLARAVIAEIDHAIANHAQILTLLGIDMRDDVKGVPT